MEPRFIIKTHTEALRPRNYSLLIAKCTYPDKSAYPEVIIKRLQEWMILLKWIEKPKPGKVSSVAKFTVILSTEKSRGFGFLLDNMVWTWKGHVINTVLFYLDKKEKNDLKLYEDLSKMEKICYLRYFLETEGAIILKFAEKFTKTGTLSYPYLRGNIQEIFREIYEGYIDIASDFRERIKIRETYSLMKSKEKYNESTLAHKIEPHLQALADLGILSTEKKNGEEIYIPVNFRGTSTFEIIFNELKDFKTMENMFSNDEYFHLIAQIYNLAPINYLYELHRDLLKETIFYGYQVMSDKTTGMADIAALIDWCCIKILSENNILVGRKDIHSFLNKIRVEDSSRIRFHVDGKGRIAYLIFRNGFK